MQPSGMGGGDEGVDSVPGCARLRVRQRVVPRIELDELERVEIRAPGERDLARRVAVLPVGGRPSLLEPHATRAQPATAYGDEGRAAARARARRGVAMGVGDGSKSRQCCWRQDPSSAWALECGWLFGDGCSVPVRAGARAVAVVAGPRLCSGGAGQRRDRGGGAPRSSCDRTTVVADRVLIIWAPYCRDPRSLVTRLFRGETVALRRLLTEVLLLSWPDAA